MSGWIKLEKDLLTDPRIQRLARWFQERDEVVGVSGQPFGRYLSQALGAVSILWITCDYHVDENDVLLLGAVDIDRLVGAQGFCERLPADWLQIIDADSVKVPGFHTHNGTEAKKKALGQRRQERHRNTRA